jgi:predicted porin
MKKSLIALAALSAFATAAQAQSSVTVYGIIDAGYVDSETKLTRTGASAKLDQTGISNSPLQTSRWGLRGTEDLGGGLRAGFQLEAGLVTDSSATTAGTSNLGNRPSFLSLSSASWGEARIGRQDTPIHASFGKFNTGGLNNMPGSIYSTFGATLAVGAADTLAENLNSGSTSAGLLTADEGASLGRYDTTIDKAVTYTTPVINGFQAQVIYSNETTKLNATAADVGSASGKAQGKHQGFNLSYNLGKLDVGYARHERKATVDAGLNTTTGAAATASSAESTQEAFGASYDFGVVKAFAQHFKMKNETQAGTVFKNDATEVGVRAPISGTKVSLWASYLEGKNKFSADNTADRTGYQVGALYALSKRTNLYGIYGDQEIKGKSGLQGTKIEQTAYSVGLRHTF